jgi:hypothetical protein
MATFQDYIRYIKDPPTSEEVRTRVFRPDEVILNLWGNLSLNGCTQPPRIPPPKKRLRLG